MCKAVCKLFCALPGPERKTITTMAEEPIQQPDPEAEAAPEQEAEALAGQEGLSAADLEALKQIEAASDPAFEAPTEPEAEAPAESEAAVPAEQEAEAPADQEGLSAADQEALKQIEASEAMEAEAPAEPEAEALAEQEAEAPAEPEAEAPLDPIAQIIAEQKAQLAGKKAPGAPSRIAQIAAEQRAKLAAAQEAQLSDAQEPPAADDQEELSEADREALQQIEAAEAMEPQAKAAKEAEAAADDKDATPAAEQSDADETSSGAGQSGSGKSSRIVAMAGPLKKLSVTHVFLLANTLAVVALVISVTSLPFRSSAVANQVNTSVAATTQKADVAEVVAPVTPRKLENASWKQARVAFGKKEYALALRHYSVLSRIALNSPEPDIVADLFQMRMAQCHEQLGKPSEAQKLFQVATASRSPVIRGLANYHMAMSEEREGHYLRARRRAYLAASALAALRSRLAMETNCAFLIARTLTGSALSFYGRGESVSWGSIRQSDPFTALDEGSLRRLLADGVKEPVQAVLGPKVQRAAQQDHTERWTATCLQTPLVELLTHFATKAKTDLRWISVDTAARNRPMNLQIRGASGQRLCELAAGSAGLIARFTGDAINVYDPSGCESLTEQRDLLVSEALVVWRRLFLRAPRDERIAAGHFVLALLQECSGDVVSAIGEYRSMARNFSNAPLAPQALLEGAKLRIELRDYSGARKELLALLDTYPDNSKSAEAYASLGEVTMKAGSPAEAFRVFKKLFFMSQSPQSRLSACLGVGKSLYKQGKYDAAVKWLGDHITLAADSGKGDLSQAYLLLGKCHSVLGNTPQAAAACQAVLATKPKADERIEACLVLAGALRSLGDLPKALAVSLQMVKEVESDPQKYQALLTAAGIYRAMGLPERGAAFLKTNILKISDPAMQAKLSIEQARCYLDAERFTDAYDILTAAPEMLSPGRGAQEAACDLAEVCLRIGRPDQAVVVAGRVLKSSPVGSHRKRARKLLAAAYLARQDYENAATTLSGIPLNQLGAKQ